VSVSSYEGGGWYIHLGLIMTNAEYLAVATNVSPPPTNLGDMATIEAGLMAAQITKTHL
jgi:hypothetical protein